ncbi:MAG: M24 family metallopeptidase [Desulfobacterales bacterium]|nr:M24 family metallopeptidase [Desulfobacterales bacterium]
MSIKKEQPFSGLSLRERDLRWQRTRKFLQDRQLDALLVIGSRHSEPLDRYLSNWIPGNTVIFPQETEPTLLVAMVPEVLAIGPDTPEEVRPWIRDIRGGTRGAVIVATLKEKGLEKGRIGTLGIGGLRTDWEGWAPYRTWERVVNSLPGCTFEDVTDAFARLMMVKSDEELALVRRSARILELAGQEMARAVAPGVSERDVFEAYMKVLLENGVHAPFQIIRSGPDTISWGQPAWLFGVGSPRVIQPGDVVLAEIFASTGGLEAQIQMAVAVPPVAAVDAECAALARRAYEKGIEHLRPGIKFGEVVDAMDAVVSGSRAWYLTPLIHNMNPMLCISATGVGIETMPGVTACRNVGTGRIRGADVVLQPGMVFELEPNACIRRHRVNIGGTAIVTENGAEPLNEISTRMQVAGGAL